MVRRRTQLVQRPLNFRRPHLSTKQDTVPKLKPIVLWPGVMLCLALSGCALCKIGSRPESMGPQPRKEAETSLELMKLFEDTSLATLGLKKEQLAQSMIGKDSLMIYHVSVADLKNFGTTLDIDKILINGFTVVFPVIDKKTEEPISSVMVQQLKKDNKWVVTRFGGANLMRSMDASRRTLLGIKGDKQGYYAVLVPSMFKYFVATGTGKDMVLQAVEGGDGLMGSKGPMPALEAFKALAVEAASVTSLCMDTPENCKRAAVNLIR
jgi:hypothetical protein